MQHLKRQLIDIQQQAARVATGSPTPVDIQNLGKYHEEVKQYLVTHVDYREVHDLLREIPTIEPFTIKGSDGLLSMIVPSGLMLLYRERAYVRQNQKIAAMMQGKYASVEFLVRNYFEE